MLVVRFDHVTSVIVNPNHSIKGAAVKLSGWTMHHIGSPYA